MGRDGLPHGGDRLPGVQVGDEPESRRPPEAVPGAPQVARGASGAGARDPWRRRREGAPDRRRNDGHGAPRDGARMNEALPESGGLRIQLPVFDGPLDLLLHLIRSNRMDIFDIPIVEIARQYDEALELMRELDLEVAGDYL